MPIPFFYVVIDCETTGLPTSKLSPFLVQLAWSVHDSSGFVLKEKDFVIKPEGFEIPEANSLAQVVRQGDAKALCHAFLIIRQFLSSRPPPNARKNNHLHVREFRLQTRTKNLTT